MGDMGEWLWAVGSGQNRRTVGHCGRTKLLLHAHRFDTLGDPIELNANANAWNSGAGVCDRYDMRLLSPFIFSLFLAGIC